VRWCPPTSWRPTPMPWRCTGICSPTSAGRPACGSAASPASSCCWACTGVPPRPPHGAVSPRLRRRVRRRLRPATAGRAGQAGP
jgi:hypothetical protein